MIVEHGMCPLPSMASGDFSEIKQNRPPNREVRGPILAKRGSYFLISKGRAKTKFTSIFINKNFNYLKLNDFISKSKDPIRSNKFKFLNPVFFKARSSPSGKKNFVLREHLKPSGYYLLGRYRSRSQDAQGVSPHDFHQR